MTKATDAPTVHRPRAVSSLLGVRWENLPGDRRRVVGRRRQGRGYIRHRNRGGLGDDWIAHGCLKFQSIAFGGCKTAFTF